MFVEQMQIFTSLLALVALTGSVLLWILRLAAVGSQRAATIGREVVALARPLAFTVAGTAMLGSLYFSEVAHYTPCKLCWYQRICMFSLAVILGVATARKDKGIVWYAVPLALIGMVVSAYHYLLEWFPQLEATSCDVTAPCTSVWFRGFGFVSLAFMAFSGFFAIVTLFLCRFPAAAKD